MTDHATHKDPYKHTSPFNGCPWCIISLFDLRPDEKCKGCKHMYRPGHLCQTHRLCGICHDKIEVTPQ